MSDDAALWPWSPTIIVKTYVTVDDRYVSKNNRLLLTNTFFDDVKEDRVFGRDKAQAALPATSPLLVRHPETITER